MTATILSFRELEAHKHIAEVTRVARELWDEKRDLEVFEEVFLSAVDSIGQLFNSYRGTAAREHGFGSDAHKAVCEMAERTQAKELHAALQSYRAERERFFNDPDETLERVAAAMSEAAE